jgi:hypothetical protein
MTRLLIYNGIGETSCKKGAVEKRKPYYTTEVKVWENTH